MEFGVQVNVYRTSWDDVRASVEAMEAGDWDSVWFADHFIPPGANREQEALTAFEGLSAIAFAGGMTKKLRLGNLVLGNTYRNPALVAKIAGTIDTASQGRFTLAIGAGWYKREHEAYGWTFPSMKERQDRFEEACELLRLLIHSDEPVDYHGTYYEADKARLAPGSYDKPIPIMVGGTGPKRDAAHVGEVRRRDEPRRLGGRRHGARVLQAQGWDSRTALRGRRAGSFGDSPHLADALLSHRGQESDRTRRARARARHGCGVAAVHHRSDRRVSPRPGSRRSCSVAWRAAMWSVLQRFEEEIVSAFK